MIEEHLMATGRWDLALKPGTPRSVRDLYDEFGHVCITPSVLPDTTATAAQVLAAARFTGVMRKRRRTRAQDRWEGPGLAFWIGEEDGKGAYNGGGSFPAMPCTITSLITAIVTATRCNGITNGGGSAATAATATVNNNRAQRFAIDTHCAASGNEWKLSPAGSFTFGTTLFRDANSVTVAFIDDDSGITHTTDLVAIGSSIENVESRDEYANGMGAWWKAPGSSYSGLTVDTDRFYDFGGSNRMKIEKVVETSQATTGTPTIDPTGPMRARNFSADPLREISISARVHDIGRFVTPGDYVYVAAPEVGLVNQYIRVRINGQTMFPMALRCIGYRWPVAPPMGVYVISNDRATVTEISDYVVPELTDTTLYVSERNPHPQSVTGSHNAVYRR